jgi:hypothetical protein
MKMRSVSLAVASALALFCSVPASATTFSYTGTFSGDADVRLFQFTLSGPPSTVILRSLGYAGGINGAGTVIPSGGFDTVLGLFDPSGTLIDTIDDGSPTVDPASGFKLDSYAVETNLGPGTYAVSLTQSFNFPLGPDLAGGFIFDPITDANFTAGLGCTQFCAATPFGFARTSAFALDIETTPIPGALPLFATGLGMFGFAAYRRKRKSA